MSRSDGQRREVARAIEQLRDAGYSLVEPGVRIGGIHSRPDIVAWAANDRGKIVPWVTVEIKPAVPGPKSELALPRLAQYSSVLGTVENYVVVDGNWLKADRHFRRLNSVNGPSQPSHGWQGEIDDPTVLEPVIGSWLAGLRDSDRLPSDSQSKLPTLEGLSVPDGVYWQATRRVLAASVSRTGFAELSSAPGTSALLARLAGEHLHGLVLDPFCGTGSFLWSVADRLRERQDATGLRARVELRGVDVNSRAVAIASAIGEVSQLPVRIEAGDAFHIQLPTADLIVTAPPVGARLQEPTELLNGQRTSDLSLAAVDLALRNLSDNGRALFLLPRSFVYRSSADEYREFLSREFRVGALIGLPRNTIPGTTIAGVVLAIDNRPNEGGTFVAQAADYDWESQLSDDGPLTAAAVGFLDGSHQGAS